MKLPQLDTGAIEAVAEWCRYEHTTLAIICQALYTITQQPSCPEDLRKAATQIIIETADQRRASR